MNSLKAILLKSFLLVFAFVVCLSLCCLRVTFLPFQVSSLSTAYPFFLFFSFLKEHFVCEVLLVDAGAKKEAREQESKNERMTESRHSRLSFLLK